MAEQLGGHSPAVQFYDDSESLCRIVSDFIGIGLHRGHPAIIIATPKHTALIEAGLRSRGRDVDALKHLGDLITVDARETLAIFMVDAALSPRAFRYHLSEVIRLVCRGRENCLVYIYGEMIDVLWKDGLATAAIYLETLWNELANTHDFKLLCSYSMGHFYKGATLDVSKGQDSPVTPEAQPAAGSQ